MSEPKTPEDSPKTTEEIAGPVEEKKDVPESTSADEKEKSAETKDAVKVNGKREKQWNLLITIGVAVVIIVAAACAFVYLTASVATKGDTVSVYYTEAFENGTVYISNMNTTEPLVFTLGNSSVIPGFEEAVTGMSVNQIKTVTIPYTKAYGAYDPGLVQTINRTGPIENTTFVVGQLYTVHYKTANTYSTIKILNVTPKTVTFDANNRMAGENLTFTIKLDNLTKKQ
ncbi:MAG: FKBP-type peptidyl-prolyl cis-trans isomerase [Methanoregula sp.]|jgi:peptidylprolyl isomerase|uniref:FKBP-type peptidyl-prolyl cis-trans isomerase n=1 Tax=Methanoregula sp. TaxID=2052170 RepID=UPI003D0D8A49